MMHPMKPLMIPIVAALFSLTPVAADAITLKEIVQLSRAGLGDEVLLALIDVDQRVFAIDPDTLRMLKDQGVSERVIVALIRSGRMQPTPDQLIAAAPVPEPQVEPEPQVVVIERERPVVQQVAVPVPIYVPVPVTTTRARRHIDDRIHIDDRTIEHDRERRRPAEPVYWGWGGKRRPDSWAESPVQKSKR
jgi:hypothetical protein